MLPHKIGNPAGARSPQRRILDLARVGLASALLWGALAGAAAAQTGAAWNTIGPAGGTVSALLTNPTSTATLYAGTPENGIFMSTDAGATWNAANAGLATSTTGRQNVFSSHALAHDGRWIYAATAAGVFYADAGAAPAWTLLPGPTSATPITMLAFDPGSSRLFAATGATDGLATPGVYVAPIDTSAAPAPVWTFTALPASPGATIDALTLVPASSSPAALLASTGSKLYSASLLPADPTLAWNDADPAGVLAPGSITAVHYSVDFLQAYACSGGSAFHSGNPLEAAPLWQEAPVASTGATPFNCHAFASLPSAAGGAPKVLLGTDEGAFVSVDGVNFVATGAPGPSLSANTFAIARPAGAAASTLFVGTGFGIAGASAATLASNSAWSASNGPATVAAGGANQRLNNASIVDTTVLGTTLYAAAVGNQYDEVFASADGGATWSATNVASVLGGNNTVLALLPDGPHGTLFAATTQGLLAYSPSSAKWSAVAAATLAGRVGALALGTSALFVGTDNGLWAVPLGAAPAAAVPVAAGLTGSSVRALLVSGGTVYAATIDATDSNFVFSAPETSAAAGTALWGAYASGSAGTDRITAMIPVGNGLLAATNGSLILYATPGSAWASANTSSDPAQQISDPFGAVKGLYSDGVSIYAATGSNGVFVSPLSTAFSWTPFSGSASTALPTLEVHTLRADGNTLYAATRAGVASFSGLSASGGGGGGGGGPPTPPPASSDSGGGALDPVFALVLLGGVLALAERRRRRQDLLSPGEAVRGRGAPSRRR
ncbi:MAG: hypothetical protein ACXWIG_03685 [Caldimonas sp.]